MRTLAACLVLLACALLAAPARADLADRRAAADGDANAALRLGVQRDTEAIPMLRDFAESRPDTDNMGHAARLALARLGDGGWEKDLLKGLSKKKPQAARLRAIRALGYVGDRETVKRLVPLLSEKGEISNTAVEALGDILPSVQTRLLLSEPNNPNRAGQWQRWWNDSRSLPPQSWE